MDDRVTDSVSIRAPAWGATGQAFRSRTESQGFNPRSRVGSDNRPAARISSSCCFNPRSRVGSDTKSGKDRAVPIDQVSIRAPAWGATFFRTPVAPLKPVSIRAPAWGATSSFGHLASKLSCFNPRSRVGSDHKVTRGYRDRIGFNPRSRVGSDAS